MLSSLLINLAWSLLQVEAKWRGESSGEGRLWFCHPPGNLCLVAAVWQCWGERTADTLDVDLMIFGSLVLPNKRRKSIPFLFLSNSPAYVLPKWSREASTCPWYPGSHLLSTGVTGPKQPVGTGGGCPAGQWDSLATPLSDVRWRAVQLAT